MSRRHHRVIGPLDHEERRGAGPDVGHRAGRAQGTGIAPRGHAEDGVTYVVGNWSEDAPYVAIVGDTIFAGSMGGGNFSYEDAIRNNLEKILTLPNDTILCPGHGPLTTVAEEKAHNPFFAGRIEPS